MTPKQPRDEWGFLPDDDRLGERVGLSPEAMTVHLVEDPLEMLPAEDPGRAEVATVDEADDEAPVVAFDDEQPEGATRWSDGDDDVEPDLEEMLESQHYAFAPEEG